MHKTHVHLVRCGSILLNLFLPSFDDFGKVSFLYKITGFVPTK